MNRNDRIVIVGGGPGGLSTARAYREAGGRGRVILLTAESYPPYRRPPLTKEYLRGEIERDELPMENPRWFEENNVELRLATAAREIDRDRQVVTTENGEEVPYDACVLATGSEPIRIPVPGADDPEILVMRTVENSERLKSRVGRGSRAVIVGSGFIGCEAAVSLSLRGADVTLVSMEEGPQKTRLGEDAARHITRWLEGYYGVDLHLGVRVEGIKRRDGGFELAVEGGENVSTETVLFGTGVRPRTGLAEAAGLEIERGGVVTNSSMRTSAPDIFAVGDIVFAMNEAAGSRQKVEHWGDALNHGWVAGTVLAGGEAAWREAPGFWSTMGDKTLKYWAWSEGWDEAKFVEKDGTEGEAFTVWYGKEGLTVGVLAHNADEDYEEGRGLIERGDPLP
ncbi:MAG: Ferredoxin reductase [uncultured Rubrobacteraceae bacterium]|uniref:Ferredoxin reductase n=1 Tax=uncultured Rubrobacteraceae bacterium TaxID=349277 RepID=A0A6J4PVQ1_9ACTN|nr:MAG: Ferredoxin reductase [uncultured Rubrobacteraceae bacterium]